MEIEKMTEAQIIDVLRDRIAGRIKGGRTYNTSTGRVQAIYAIRSLDDAKRNLELVAKAGVDT